MATRAAGRTLLVAALLLAPACADQGPVVDDVPIYVTAVVAGTPISTIVVVVTAADISPALVFNLTLNNGVASGTIRVPPGAARTITVTAFDAENRVTHEGSVVVDVVPGQNPPVSITLRPRVGDVPVTVTLGNFGVVVTPSQASIDLAVSATLQLDVTVMDVDGDPIPAPEVAWATSHPAVATVSPSGLVTALRPGTATIVAVYGGVAGFSTITVTDGGPPNPPSPIVQNGDFEAGSNGAWQESSTGGFTLIGPPPPGIVAHSGTFVAWLGGADLEVSIISQQVTLPANAASLTFYLWRGTSETVSGADFLHLQINGNTVLTIDLGSVGSSISWQQHVVNISAFAGQTVLLTFGVLTDASRASSVFVDDVTVN
jgi:Big-like domain-containing protein